jgi:hypothetical protein
MISARKISANRTNAKASTGPRTARGKSTAAQNARRHGLSLSIFADSIHAAEAENLVREIAGVGASPGIIEIARRIAEAEIDLMRVRQARHELFKTCPSPDPSGKIEPNRAQEFAVKFAELAKRLSLIDRYERRALSRRKFAIRELDALRRQTAA